MKRTETAAFREKDEFIVDLLTVLNELSIDSLLNGVSVKCCNMINASYCIAGLTNDEGGFERVAVYGFTANELARMKLSPVHPVVIRDLASETPLNLTSKKEIAALTAFFPEKFPRIYSLLYLPLTVDGAKRGAMILMNKIGGGGFSDSDMRLMRLAERIVVTGMRSVTSYEKVAAREEEMTHRYDNLALLNELSKISTSRRDDLESLVDTTMDTIMTTLDIDVGEYFYQDAKNGNYRLLYKRGHKLSRSILGFTEVTPGQGLVGEAIAKKTPYVLKADELDVVNGSKATQVRLNYVIILPLLTPDTVIGAICLGTRLLTDPPTMDERFLTSVGSYFSLLIQEFLLLRERNQTAILEERNRIGMDLHDGVIQSIFGVGLSLEHVRITVKDDPEAASERIQEAIQALNATIRDIRSYIMNLKPARLTNENLIQSMRRLANDFYSNTFVPTEFKSEIEDIDRLSPEHVNVFYMVCKETLANIAKHAHAQRVAVRFYENEHDYVLTIKDDGVGFDDRAGRKPTSNGITNMTQRAKSLNGMLLVQSQPNQGTTLSARIPK